MVEIVKDTQVCAYARILVKARSVRQQRLLPRREVENRQAIVADLHQQLAAAREPGDRLRLVIEGAIGAAGEVEERGPVGAPRRLHHAGQELSVGRPVRVVELRSWPFRWLRQALE